MYVSIGLHRSVKYIRLVAACIVKTAIGIQCLCFALEKAGLCPCLFVSHRRVFVCFRHNQSAYLVFRTTRVTRHKTKTSSYSFPSRIKQLYFLALQTYEKKSCRVSVPLQPIIPWCDGAVFSSCDLVQSFKNLSYIDLKLKHDTQQVCSLTIVWK